MSTITKFGQKIVGKFSPHLISMMSYWHHHGFRVWGNEINNSMDLSQIWINKIHQGYFLPFSHLADKYAVRDYIKKKGLEDILIPLITYYEKPDDFHHEELPSQFVLKLNTLAQSNLVVTDKSLYDEQYIRNLMSQWFIRPGSRKEKHYDLIPRKVVCEKFIGSKTGKLPVDYKFLCIKGVPRCILACGDRESGHNFAVYDTKWNWLPSWRQDNPTLQVQVEKPSKLGEMLEIARRLSEGIDLVRIDLYQVDEKIYFGEITLTPAGGTFPGWSREALLCLSSYYFNAKI